MKMLEVKDLTIELGGVKVLENVTFDVEKGDVLAIIGPNGAGKTVLLKSLLGLIPYTGTVLWSPGIKRSYVPQRMDIETDVPLTVMEFFGLRGFPVAEDKLREALGFVQLDPDILRAGFGEVSVGQRQRILVAWAVLGDPDVLLFDEPTADIDIAGQESIYKMIPHLQKNLGLTVILVSHDLNIVYRHATSVVCLNRKNLCYGAPREVLTPEQLLALYGGEKAFFKHEHK
ncbi:MAG TPA: metal ABC transporter ATP-binding protein [Thermodesulfobacteriota bacterium]|nr:metal ABC transporter ATP-binding protein [Thermodesulfobacteriota bacterium]